MPHLLLCGTNDMIQILNKNKQQTGSGWEVHFYSTKKAPIKEVTIACGWNKHWLKENRGVINVLRGTGHVSINNNDEMIVTKNATLVIEKHSLVDFQHSQIEYLFVKNPEEFEKKLCSETTIFTNHPGGRTILYVLEGKGTMIEPNGRKTVIKERDAIEMSGEDLLKLKGDFKILRLFFKDTTKKSKESEEQKLKADSSL